jgi:hypothetical protein
MALGVAACALARARDIMYTMLKVTSLITSPCRATCVPQYADAHALPPLQKVKLQPVWQRLDAELDCRAAHSVAEEVTVTFDDNVGSNNTAMPTVDSLPGRDSVPDALWPSLAARQAAYSSSGNQQAWLQDLSQVCCVLWCVVLSAWLSPEVDPHQHSVPISCC